MIKTAILGAAGRMGQMLLRCSKAFPDIKIVAAVESHNHPELGEDAGILAGIRKMNLPIMASWPDDAQVVIDFTLHSATRHNIVRALSCKQAVVLGTTGLSDADRHMVNDASKSIPIIWSPNFSLGVNLLFDLVRYAAAVLHNEYDIEIIETHHRLKKDAPSGTALGLAAAAASGREVSLENVANFGRHGIVGERPSGQIGIHSVRGGDVVGDHAVVFAADGERIELHHKASSREAFAKGALAAARWLKGRSPGLYSMRDVLGLN